MAVRPRSSGWKLPARPARRVERRMYVTKAITGIYISGELMSSRGGRKYVSACPLEFVRCPPVRDHGLCRQGNSTRPSLLRT